MPRESLEWGCVVLTYAIFQTKMCNLFFSVSDLTKNSILFFISDQIVANVQICSQLQCTKQLLQFHVSSSEMCFKLIKGPL